MDAFRLTPHPFILLASALILLAGLAGGLVLMRLHDRDYSAGQERVQTLARLLEEQTLRTF